MDLNDAYFSSVFSNSSIGVVIVDENTNILSVNDYMFQYFKLNPKEYKGKRFGNVFGCSYVADGAQICGAAEQCEICDLRNGVLYVLKDNVDLRDIVVSHTFLIENNVIEKWFLISASPIKNENGKNILITFVDITESKLLEIHLNESKEKFEMIDKNATDMICIHQPDGRFIYLSSSCKNILGYEPEELIGVSPYDLFSQKYIDMIRNKHENILHKSDVDNVIRYEMKRKDNSFVWLETLNNYIVDESTNEISQIISVSRVVTDKVEQEITMKRMVEFSEELLQMATETDAYQIILDNILYLSKAKYGVINLFDENGENFTTVAISGINGITGIVKKYLGFDVVGKVWNRDVVRENKIKDNVITHFSNLSEIAGGAVPKSIIKSIEKIFHLGETIVVKILKDERVLGDFTLIMSDNMKFENENLIEIYSKQIGMLITRNRTEQTIEKNEKKKKAMLENISDVIGIVDKNGIIKYITPNIETLFGYAPKEHIGSKFWYYMHPNDLEAIMKDFPKFLNSDNSVSNVNIRFRLKDGSYSIIHITAKNLLNDTNIGGILVNYHDITNSIAAKNALEQRDKLLQAISIATKDLLGHKYDKSIVIGLELIGKAANADRAYYFQNNFDHQNNLISTSQKAEWCSNSSEPQINNPELQNIPVEAVDIFLNPLLQRKPFKALVEELEESETKDILMAQQIVSILVLPMFVNEIFWGFMGFDDCKNEREWTDAEISTLQIYIDSVSKVIEREQLENRLKYYYYHDQLTDLYNRRFIFDNLNEIDNEKNYPLSIIVADINGLRSINEAFGFNVGDEIIKKFASVIKNCCMQSCVSARWGGDDFVILLPNKGKEETREIIQKANDLLKEHSTKEAPLTVAFGIATKCDNNDTLKSTIRFAEEEMLKNKSFESTSIQSSSINMILQTLHEKNKREEMHSRRVSEICVAIGKAMNFSNEDVNKLRTIGLVHDIGKIGIDEHILNKAGKLNSNECNEVKQHTEIGYRILSANKQTSELAFYVLSHHERLDGSGYPNGIKGDAIALFTRILSVADSVDAMTSKRTYSDGLTYSEAVKELLRCSGTQFDEMVVKIFIERVLPDMTLI